MLVRSKTNMVINETKIEKRCNHKMKIDPVSWRLVAPNADSVLVDVHHGCRRKTLARSGPAKTNID